MMTTQPSIQPSPLSSQASDLYSAALELNKTVKERLPNLTHHVIIVRLLKFLRDVSSAVLDFGRDREFDVSVSKVFFESSKILFDLQIEYLGEFHPDVGTTCLDVAEGIKWLLAKDPQALFDMKIEGLQSVVQCSKFEGQMRKKFNTIKVIHT